MTLRIGLLLSGNGSVLQTLLSAIGDGSLDAKVEAVKVRGEARDERPVESVVMA